MKYAATGLLALPAHSAPAIAQAELGYGHAHMWDGYGGAWMFMGPVIWLIVLALIGAGVVAAVRWLGADQRSAQGGGALATLDERFAKGEIDAKEYTERKALLTK